MDRKHSDNRYKSKQRAAREEQLSMPGTGRRRTLDGLTGICFGLILAIFVVAGIALPDKKFSASENRMLQTRPQFSVADYMSGRFESRAEDYINDQFPLRSTFVRIKAAADKTEGRLETNGVIRCRDSYLMERIQTPDADNLQRLEQALASFRERHRSMPMYFMMVPNAANVLSDKLPATVRQADQNEYMDAFFAAMDAAGYVSIDVRGDFENARKTTQLYYRTDHHWTSDGAYLAYRRAARTMGMGSAVEYAPYVVKNDFCGTLYSKSGFVNGKYDDIKIYLPQDKEQYEDVVIYYTDTQEKTTGFFQVDNLQKKDAYSVFGGSNHPMYTIRTTAASNERIMVVKDSYANSFIPFLSQHYREIVVVDPRYYFDNVEELMDTEGVTQVLFLYNANTLFKDTSLAMMLEEEE